MCRKYIGQMIWLTIRTRPDISACMGMLASLVSRRPRQVKSHLVDLWTTMHYAMCALASPMVSAKIFQKEQLSGMSSECLKIQIYCDASFAPGGGRSRSGILILLVSDTNRRASFDPLAV